MARLNRFAFSILIASVLLLSAVSNGRSQRKAGEAEISPQNEQASSRPISTPITEQHTGSPTGDSSKATDNYYGKFGYFPENGASQSDHTILFTVIGLLLTGGLLATSCLSYKAADRSARATEEAAKAAKDSAEAADASLHVYRPYLVATTLDMGGTISVNTIPAAFYIHIMNDGIGPADIVRYHMEATVYNWHGVDEPIPEYDPAEALKVIHSVVAAREEKTLPREDIPRPFDVSPEEFSEMRAGKKRLGLHGIIFYKGGPTKEYWTRFFWWYLVDTPGATYPLMVRANRPEVNAHT